MDCVNFIQKPILAWFLLTNMTDHRSTQWLHEWLIKLISWDMAFGQGALKAFRTQKVYYSK